MPSQLDIEEQRWRDAFNEGANGVLKLAQETLDLRDKTERLTLARKADKPEKESAMPAGPPGGGMGGMY